MKSATCIYSVCSPYHLDCILVSLSVRFDVARVGKFDPDKQNPHEY